MKLVYQQFRALMWKCWLLRKRNLFTSLCEFLFPFLANIVMVITLYRIIVLFSSETDENNITKLNGSQIWPNSTFDLKRNLWKFILFKPEIMYAPENECTKKFIHEFDTILKIRTGLNITFVKYLSYSNEEQLVKSYIHLNKHSSEPLNLVAVIFNNKSSDTKTLARCEHQNNYDAFDNFLDNFSYKIRTASYALNALYPEKKTVGPYNFNIYLGQGNLINNFLELQIFVNEAYLSLLLKRQKTHSIDSHNNHQFLNFTFNQPYGLSNIIENLSYPQFVYNLIFNSFNYENSNFANYSINSKIQSLITKKFRKMFPFFDLKHSLFVQNIETKRLPYPKYIERPPNNLLDIVPAVIMNSFIILVPLIVKRMSDEKVNRVREMFKILGLNRSAYFLSTFFNYMLGILPQTVIIVVLYTTRFTDYVQPVYFYTNPVLIFCTLVLYCINLILMAMLISIITVKPVFGVVVSVLIFLSTGITHYFLDPHFNKSLNPYSMRIEQLIFCLLPNVAINFILRLVSLKELYNYGALFSNMFEYTQSYGVLSIGSIMLVQIASCFIMCLLIWYLDAVWPTDYGISKPWTFPFQPLKKYIKKINYLKKNDFIIQQSLNAFIENKLFPNKPKFFEKEFNLSPDKVAFSIKNLTKIYNNDGERKLVLDNFNLELMKNQLTTLLGQNGAGKTTLMNIITGMCPLTRGKIYINQYNIQTETDLARKSISLCPQHNILYDELNAEEHLYLFGIIKGIPLDQIQNEIFKIIKKLHFTSHAKIISKNYSGGIKRKLSLAIALIGNSEILILDEPTSGMDPETRRIVLDVLLELRRQKTILLCTHYLEEADAISDKIFIMLKGTVCFYGTPAFLKYSFGTGCQLRFAKNPDFYLSNKNELKKLIDKHFFNSKIYNENQDELFFTINNENDDSQKFQDGQFAQFFNEFENLKKKLNICSCGISYLTLEDAFLKIISKENNLDAKIIKDEDFVDKKSYYLINENETKKLNLLYQQVKALIIKRFHYLKRTYKLLLVQLLVPLFVFSLILVLDDFLRQHLQTNQELEINYLKMYNFESSKGFFQYDKNDNNSFFNTYKMTAEFKSISIQEIDLKTDFNEFFVNQIQNISISEYTQKYLLSATSEKYVDHDFNERKISNKIDSFNFKLWYNNEILHSLPMTINLIYESIINYFKLKNSLTNENLEIPIINHPFPNQYKYILHYSSISEFKIMWCLIVSLSLPFLAAYYLIFPSNEYLSKSKLLQLMTGLPCFLYWSISFIYDLAIHFIACILILFVFYLFDNLGIFFAYHDSMLALFFLLFLNGIVSILIAYIYSQFASSVNGGYMFYLIFNLIFGLILNLIDYIIFFLTEFAIIRKTTYHYIIWVFRIFPIYSMTQGITNLYEIGSIAHICDEMPKDLLNLICFSKAKKSILFGCCEGLCGNSCYRYKTPFNWSCQGVFNQLLVMSLVSLICLILLIIIELGRKSFKNYFQKYKSFPQIDENCFNIEDFEVINERKRIENLKKLGTNLNDEDELVVDNLKKVYKMGKFAVNGLTFGIKKNECFGLLGINGAGKTTTFRMLVGDLLCSDGNATISNFELNNNLKEFQKQIGYCPQFDALINKLTGEEMLYLFARLRGLPENQLKVRIDRLIKMIDLNSNAKKTCLTYSGGTRRKLSLGLALIGCPKLIFLDEPTAGIDSESRQKIWNTLTYVKRVNNCSILLTSHSMKECEVLCSRIAIMINGWFKCLGSIQHLRNKYGQGFSLTIKLSQKFVNDNSYINLLKKKLSKTFNQCVLKDIHQAVIIYQILDTNTTWTFLFNQMDLIKKQFSLEYYLIGDTTLEQIFVNFARQN